MIQAEDLGFGENPFSELPDPRYTFRHRAFQAVCADLLYARMSERQGFTVVTGSEGSGKTALLQLLHEERASADRYHTFAAHRKLTFQRLLQQAVEAFGIVSRDRAIETDRDECFDLLKSYVLANGQEGGRVIFLIDRAESLTFETLEDLADLVYLGEGDGRLLQIILTVRTEAGSRALPRAFRAVIADVAFQVHLGPISASETESYLLHRLMVAGYEGAGLFDSSALEELTEISGGNPLRINRLARIALQICQAEGNDKVRPGAVNDAAEQCGYDGPPPHDPEPDEEEPLPTVEGASIKRPQRKNQTGGVTGIDPDSGDVEPREEKTVIRWPKSGARQVSKASTQFDERENFSLPAAPPPRDPAKDALAEAEDLDNWPLDYGLDSLSFAGKKDDLDPSRDSDARPQDSLSARGEGDDADTWDHPLDGAGTDRVHRRRDLNPGPDSVWRTRFYAMVGMLCIGAVVFWLNGGEDKPGASTVQFGAEGAQSGAIGTLAPAEPVVGAASGSSGDVAMSLDAKSGTEAKAEAPSSEAAEVGAPSLPLSSADAQSSEGTAPSAVEKLAALNEGLAQISAGPDHLPEAEDPKAAEIENLKNQLASLAADVAALQKARDHLAASLETGRGEAKTATSSAPSLSAAPADSGTLPASAETQLALLPPPIAAKPPNPILDLQSRLKLLGYKIGRPDGRLGARTVQAIRKYQRDHDLLIDGAASPALIKHVSAFSSLKTAVVKYHEGDYDEAAKLYSQVAQLQPGDPESQLLQALVNLRLGETDNARFDLAEKATGFSNSSSYVYYRPGRIYFIQERLQELGYSPGRQDGMMVRQTEDAITAYERNYGLPISGRPTIALLKHLEVQSQHNNAIEAYHRGDLLKALELYNLVLRLDPRDAEAYFNRGLTYRVLGRSPEALADYERAAALNPDLSKIYFDRGNIRWDQGSYREALADYWWALKTWW